MSGWRAAAARREVFGCVVCVLIRSIGPAWAPLIRWAPRTLGPSEDRNPLDEILATPLMRTASSAGGGFSNVRTLKADGAPPGAFRGLSEDHFELIVVDADRSVY